MKKETPNFNDYPIRVPSIKTIDAKANALLDELKKVKDAQEAKVVIRKWNRFFQKVETEIGVISVKYTLDINNPKIKKAQDKCDEMRPLIANYYNAYQKILTSAPYRKSLEKAFGEYLFKMYDASLKGFDEKIIPDLIKENKLVSEYDAVMGGAQIPFRGETLNLSQLGKHLSSADREERKEAAIALDKWLCEHDETIGNIYDQMVKIRTEIAHKLGYENYVELGYIFMGRTDYNAKDVANYRAQISREIVPVAQKLYKNQVKSLGIQNPQYFDYALRFKSGNAKPLGDEKVLVKAAREMYEEMSPETHEFFEFMLSHNLMDLTARKGKQPGGYCTFFPLYKSPFIFSNFNHF